MDSTQRYRRDDLAKYIRMVIREGDWNSEVHDAVLKQKTTGDIPTIVVVFKDNKRLRVTVEAMEQ